MRSLRTQLLVSHLLLVLLMGVVMSVAISGYFRLERSIDEVLGGNFPTVLAARDLESSLAGQDTALALLAGGHVESAPKVYAEALVGQAAALRMIESSVTEADEKSLALQLRLGIERQNTLAQQLFNSNQLSPQSGVAETVELRIRPTLSSLRQICRDLAHTNEQAIVDANSSAHADAQSSANRALALVGVGLVTAIFLSLRMVRISLTPLAVLAKQAESIAGGDLSLSLRLPRKDEIGALADSFNAMTTKLVEVRKSEVRKLQRVQRMSDAALDSLYDPVIVTDTKQRIVHLNRAAEEIFGAAPASPRRAADAHFQDPRILRAIESTANPGMTHDEDERGLVTLSVGGTSRTYRMRASPMRDDEQKLLGGVVVLEDVTQLRELDQLKTEFIGVAAHELRTPVASLLLSTELMLEGAVGELTEDQAEIVRSQIDDLTRLEKLMRDLLDTSKLGSKEISPHFEVVKAGQLITPVVPSLRTTAVASNVTLVVILPPDLPELRADSAMIGRVITNLVSNAIRHTKPGGTVTLTTSTENNMLNIRVRDTGEGIPAEYLHRIFERFVQVPGATGGGAGLGLPIAKAIVEAHHGTMYVDSIVGDGSTFGFTLPLGLNGTGEGNA